MLQNAEGIDELFDEMEKDRAKMGAGHGSRDDDDEIEPSDGNDGWIDEHEELTKDEQKELDRMIHPVKLALAKVSQWKFTFALMCDHLASFKSLHTRLYIL